MSETAVHCCDAAISVLLMLMSQNVFHVVSAPPPPEGGTPLFGLYGDVPLDRVWLLGLAVLNRVYNLTCLCPKQGQNLS